MKNYRVQNGCYNCQFHITYEFEPNQPIYICNYEGLFFLNDPDEIHGISTKEWNKVPDDKVVDDNGTGICDLYQLKD